MSEHRVILADCLGPEGLCTLADKSVDHVITDPPYSEHVHTRSMRGAAAWKGVPSERADLGFGSLDGRTLLTASGEFARIARRWVLVFSDTESAHLWREALESRGLEYVRTCFWHKVCGTPQFTGDRPAVACEAITVCHQPGRKKWNGGGKQGIYPFPVAVERPGRQQDDARVHTTQKPLALMEALIRDFTNPGDLIADPFAGAGSTIVAAKRLGRLAVGWDYDQGDPGDPDENRPPREPYAAIAQKRIDGAREQLGLFKGTREPEPKQESLLAASSLHGGR
jgi:site-specific DNA-methyltransferase (adenine-specific)